MWRFTQTHSTFIYSFILSHKSEAHFLCANSEFLTFFPIFPSLNIDWFNYFHRCCERKPTVQLNIRNTTVDVSELLEDIYTPYTFVVWASLDNTTSSKVRKSIRPYEDSKYFNIWSFFVMWSVMWVIFSVSVFLYMSVEI